MDSFHIWYKWLLAWEGVLHVMTFDLDPYLQGHSTLFWLGIQHDSIVWVIMRRRGVSSERRRSSCSSSLCLKNEIFSLNSAWKWLKWCWTCWEIKEWQQGVPKRPIILWRTYLWHVWDCKTVSFYIVWTKHTLTWAAFCKNYATCWAYIMFTNGRRSETFYFW